MVEVNAVGNMRQQCSVPPARAATPPPSLQLSLSRCHRVCPYPCLTLQYQNSSLTAEVPQLLGDVDLLLSWATQAFGEWRCARSMAPLNKAVPWPANAFPWRWTSEQSTCWRATRGLHHPGRRKALPAPVIPAPAGGLPEAVNLWIGDERSVTSWHKDPFENIYAVGLV